MTEEFFVTVFVCYSMLKCLFVIVAFCYSILLKFGPFVSRCLQLTKRSTHLTPNIICQCFPKLLQITVTKTK